MSINELSINLTLGNVAYILIVFCACVPSLAKHFYMFYRLIFGTLYPTYLSYKALKQKDDNECARMMMYWIVFAIFTFLEGFLDIFVGLWFPFYFESKIIFLFWLISPYGNGAKILYENFVLKKFEQNEKAIDDFISDMKHFSVALFWKTWKKCSIYINYFLVLFFNKVQIAFIQHMNNQNELFNIQNPFNLTSFNTSKTILPKTIVEDSNLVPTVNEAIEEIQNIENVAHEEEIEPSSVMQVDSLMSEDEALEVKRPGRKTKRKRRVVTDISNRPNTRATSKSQPTSDVEML